MAVASTTRTIAVTLHERLVAQIDNARGEVPRTAWIRRAVAERLAKVVDQPKEHHDAA